jgi:hypothetical protein
MYATLFNQLSQAALIVQFLVFGSLVWLAGSLPLLTHLSGPNVSELGEVSGAYNFVLWTC